MNTPLPDDMEAEDTDDQPLAQLHAVQALQTSRQGLVGGALVAVAHAVVAKAPKTTPASQSDAQMDTAATSEPAAVEESTQPASNLSNLASMELG